MILFNTSLKTKCYSIEMDKFLKIFKNLKSKNKIYNIINTQNNIRLYGPYIYDRYSTNRNNYNVSRLPKKVTAKKQEI